MSMIFCQHRDLRPSLHCSFWGEDMDAAQIWRKAHEFLHNQGAASEAYRINPGIGSRRNFRDFLKEMSPQDIEHEISLDPASGFTVQSGGDRTPQIITYHPTPLDGGLQGFSIASLDAGNLPIDWSDLVELLSSMAPLVVAKSTLSLYSAWQNCEDIGRYTRQFGSAVNFKQYEKGDPPVNRIVLDTSRNPGRNHVRDALSLGVSAEMWLGPAFWQFAPCRKEEVLAADFFLEVRDTPQFLYLKSWPHPFTRPDGEQGRIQQMLWRLLFHEDCEWPPGSGGISDEPAGGPPELMPGYPPVS